MEVGPRVIDVWPENLATWETWRALETQWRKTVGMFGGCWDGIEYASIPMALEMAGVTAEQRQDVLAGLRDMQAAALPVLNGEENRE